MSTVLKDNWAWMISHATQNPETKGWRCKETGAAIGCIEVTRLIHYFWMDPEKGTSAQVLHLYCPGCNPQGAAAEDCQTLALARPLGDATNTPNSTSFTGCLFLQAAKVFIKNSKAAGLR